MNALEKFNQKQIETLTEKKEIPDFRAGDTVKVSVRIVEGEKERIQHYEGVCIARKNAGINSAFTVRKISHGEGVERVFPLYGPRVENIEVVRRGEVRRAKLYYMRNLSGKSARIKERLDPFAAEREAAVAEAAVEAPAEEAKAKEAAPAKEAKAAAPKEAK